MEQYITEALMLILGALVGWFPNRKKQKVDTKQIEVEVLEKALIVIEKNVVEPLTNRFILLQTENDITNQNLKKLQNAINKMYNCRSLSNCPIRIELSKPEGNNRKGNAGRPRANRPRDSTNRDNDQSGDDSSDNSDSDDHGGTNS